MTNSRIMQTVGWVIVVLVVALNIYLLAGEALGLG